MTLTSRTCCAHVWLFIIIVVVFVVVLKPRGDVLRGEVHVLGRQLTGRDAGVHLRQDRDEHVEIEEEHHLQQHSNSNNIQQRA